MDPHSRFAIETLECTKGKLSAENWTEGRLSFDLLSPVKGNKLLLTKQVSLKKFPDAQNLEIAYLFKNQHLLSPCHYFPEAENLTMKNELLKGLCIVKDIPEVLEETATLQPLLFANGPEITKQFIKNLRGLVRAVSYVHSMDRTFGNLSLSSSWTIHETDLRFTIKLNPYAVHYHDESAEFDTEKRRDWHEFGETLSRISSILTQRVKGYIGVTFNDFVGTLMDGNLEIDERFLLSHPLFWVEEMTCLVVNLWNVIKARKMCQLLDQDAEAVNIVPCPLWTGHVDQNLLAYMNKEKGGGSYTNSASDYLQFMRNTIEHFDLVPHNIQRIVGNTRLHIMQFFHELQPNTILALRRFAIRWNEYLGLEKTCSFLIGQ